MPTYMVTDPSTGVKVKLTGDAPPTEQDLAQVFASISEANAGPQLPDSEADDASSSVLDEFDKAALSVPGVAEMAEVGAGIGRSVFGFLDFLTTDNVNAILELSGSDYRVPSIADAVGVAPKGSFTEPGLAQDILAGTGEASALALGVGSSLRKLAQASPQMAQSVGQRVLQQAAGGTAAGDVALSTAGVIGAEAGEEIGGTPGAIVGSVVAPMMAIKTAGGLKSFLSQPSQAEQLAVMPDKVASKVLFESMRREGMDVGDFARIMDDLGDQAIVGDAGNVFRRNLRAIINKVPNIEGAAVNAMGQRQQGQAARILNSFDEASGLRSIDVDDQIAILNASTKPQIKALYDQARAKSIQMSPRLRALFDGDNAIARSQNQVKKALADVRATGREVSNIDLIDETKRVLDDQIGSALRSGEANKARRIIELKNLMVAEADKSIPEYKQARNLFAGKANLENSAELGESLFRMSPGDVKSLVSTMGESEKRMFVLGAKKAITDKVMTANVSSDAVKRIFNKRGDIEKLKNLFPDESEFLRFSKAMRREGEFIATRNALQGNSTTIKQAEDVAKVEKFFDIEGSLNPVKLARNIAAKRKQALSDQEVDAFERGLQKAGELMLKQGGSREVMDILVKASDDHLNRILSNIYPNSISGEALRASAAALGAQQPNLQEGEQ